MAAITRCHLLILFLCMMGNISLKKMVSEMLLKIYSGWQAGMRRQ